VRQAATFRIKEMIEPVAQQFPDSGKTGTPECALAVVATMVGTLVLPRAVNDPELAEALCQIGR
jgi:hypothetical protein